MTKGGVLLCFGYGYSAAALARRLRAGPEGANWRILGTTRKPEKAAGMRAEGVEPLLEAGDVERALAEADHLLISAGPSAGGGPEVDPTLAAHGAAIAAAAERIAWVGYLSTTGVYGDHAGGWVDETAPRAPATDRGRLRVVAEDAWMALYRERGAPVHLFRLAGIYGPGRGPFEKVRQGTARRIVKPGQVFSRIHVDDIAAVLEASIARPNPGAAYNVCDDDPAPPQDVIAHAADLLGLPAPPEVPFEIAKAEMSPMAVSFYAESKRVSNRRIREELGVRLAYPDYRSGLAAVLAAEER
ncbi:MAG: SDR family oxidoreductase [Pseudomonadota bacterium]